MRTLERRLEAVEAKHTPRTSANLRLFFQKAGTDPVEFYKQCEIDAAGAKFMVVRFVASRRERDDGIGGTSGRTCTAFS